MNKDQLKSTALKQRIGEIVASYEDQLADFRAEATMQISNLEEENRRLNELLEEARAEPAA